MQSRLGRGAEDAVGILGQALALHVEQATTRAQRHEVAGPDGRPLRESAGQQDSPLTLSVFRSSQRSKAECLWTKPPSSQCNMKDQEQNAIRQPMRPPMWCTMAGNITRKP